MKMTLRGLSKFISGLGARVVIFFGRGPSGTKPASGIQHEDLRIRSYWYLSSWHKRLHAHYMPVLSTIFFPRRRAPEPFPTRFVNMEWALKIKRLGTRTTPVLTSVARSTNIS